MHPPVIEPAAPEDLRSVLRLTLATPDQPRAELERQVNAFIRHAREMRLDLTRQWVCKDGDRIVDAATCLESPGRTALLFLPDGRTAEADTPAADDLVRHVVEQESRRPVRLLQCLVNPDDVERFDMLRRLGFIDLATLRYMEWNAKGQTARAGPVRLSGIRERDVRWDTYAPASHADFARLIAETYRRSRDCPGLHGLRDIEDVIAGHKATGRFDPRRWLLLRNVNEPVGCILFGENPLRPTLELTYMGVHPDRRRNNVGKYILQHGLSLARRERFHAVTLAVDADNAPALALYDWAGFRETIRRRALILALESTSDEP